MIITDIWGKSASSSSLILVNGKTYRKVTISCEGESLTLPVTPWKYSITTSQNNKVIDILDSGEALLFGNTRLTKLKFGCFFPNQERHKGHKYWIGDNYAPEECIDRLMKWKNSKKPVRVIITSSPVNLAMALSLVLCAVSILLS